MGKCYIRVWIYGQVLHYGVDLWASVTLGCGSMGKCYIRV